MDNKKLAEILLELRSNSKQLGNNPSEQDVRALMNKYNMLFLGSSFNHIYSHELWHSIKNTFNYEISLEELNLLIPIVCKSLGMNFESMIEAKNIGTPNPPIGCYAITLW